MPKKKARKQSRKGDATVEAAKDLVPATPPPDNPQLRHAAEGVGVDDATAAALRLEAIQRTREMGKDGKSPPDE